MSQSSLAGQSPRGATLALRYACFAAICTAINIAVQAASMAVYDGRMALTLAMLLGTIAGLVPKYLLDKRWIFNDRSQGLQSHGRKFTLYTLMSVATTLIFWVTEFAFDRIGHGDGLHYLGAVIGLAIGYWVKYRLDRRFTFGDTA
jgi:putative flippase GtrA